MGEGVTQEGAGKLAEMIPTFYYDIIARVLPGCSLLSALMWAGSIRSEVLPVNAGEFGNAIAFLAAGYIVGMLLSIGSGALMYVTGGLVMRHLGAPADLQSVWTRIDAIGSQDSGAGAILSKMAAEATMFHNLLVAFAIVTIPLWSRVHKPLAVLGLAATAIGSVSRVHLLMSRLSGFEAVASRSSR
ncbi:MAG TPA: hypothetical protein VLV78_02260 [Thermoanaerobaculia bacterium]|nr:hypothetical protein [Thermoanaerobaculia bacterium]